MISAAAERRSSISRKGYTTRFGAHGFRQGVTAGWAPACRTSCRFCRAA